MARLRYVGKPAANPEDFLTQRELTAFDATLPFIYTRINQKDQPSGIVGLDANARMNNAQLPLDISRTTLTSSGKTKAGSLEITGAATIGTTLEVSGALSAASVASAAGITAAADINATGAISGASLDVGSGNVRAGTMNIPENTNAAFKAKATTLDSVNTLGLARSNTLETVGAASIGGALTAPSLTTTNDIQAGQQLRGNTASITGVANVGSLYSAGAVTVDGQLVPNTIRGLGQEDVLNYLNQRIADLETQMAAAVGNIAWTNISPTASNVSSSGTEPIQYRIVTQNGQRILQLRGTAIISGGISVENTTLWVMPAIARPVGDRNGIPIARDHAGGSAVAKFNAFANGNVQVNGLLTGVRGTTSMDSVALTSSTTTPSMSTAIFGPTFAHDHKFLNLEWGTTDGYRNTDSNIKNAGDSKHNHTVSGGAHNHTVPAHSHGLNSVLAATQLSFNGVFYYL